MADELLPKVELWHLGGPARQMLADLVSDAVCEALEARDLKRPKPPAGALRAKDAASYVGVSRSAFYKILDDDPQLKGLSFTVGKSRMWPTADLDSWMQARRAQLEPPKAQEAPGRDRANSGVPDS